MGDAPRILNIRMPQVQIFNMAFLKEIPLHEKTKLVFRAELYGALNHPNISTNRNDYSLYTGLSYQATVGGSPVPTAANILPSFSSVSTNIGGTRTIQLGAKLYF